MSDVEILYPISRTGLGDEIQRCAEFAKVLSVFAELLQVDRSGLQLKTLESFDFMTGELRDRLENLRQALLVC